MMLEYLTSRCDVGFFNAVSCLITACRYMFVISSGLAFFIFVVVASVIVCWTWMLTNDTIELKHLD